ncbi:DMT family transporter [Ideonella sp.]|uniref:DMT family transporter n=1 Tax=Ideonella sp. TaxID=1929293 RepID=UPI003BB5AC6E
MSVALPRSAGWAVAALLSNAMVWGLTWWPMRELQHAGLHPLWATVLIFSLSVSVIGVLRPAAWSELARHPSLWLIVLAAGTTNACFNWGVTAGDVVRVVLLFYLMPLWTVLLARWLLHEAITAAALLRVALALAGAALVLWPQNGTQLLDGDPIDLLGLLGGFSFAVNNVMLRRLGQRSEAARGLAMFLGGGLVSLVLALIIPTGPLPELAPGWLLICALLATCYLGSNMALQYGATRLPANVTAVVMLTEVLWATASSVALGAGQMSPALALGGALIVGAAALSAWRP